VVTVLLPGLLADQAGGQKEFQLEAPTVGAALQALPVRDLLFNERNELRPLVNVYVDGDDIRGERGVDTEVRDGQTVRVVAAVAGG
jgi:molybdopterin converting factor small subunit